MRINLHYAGIAQVGAILELNHYGLKVPLQYLYIFCITYLDDQFPTTLLYIPS